MSMRRRCAASVGFGLISLLVILGGSAMALCPNDCELFWTAPTLYTDNTAIEPADLPLSYIAEWDGVLLPMTTATFVPVPKPYGHDVPHTARVKAITARGSEGAFSPPFPWNSPKGIPGGTPGIGVR